MSIACLWEISFIVAIKVAPDCDRGQHVNRWTITQCFIADKWLFVVLRCFIIRRKNLCCARIQWGQWKIESNQWRLELHRCFWYLCNENCLTMKHPNGRYIYSTCNIVRLRGICRITMHLHFDNYETKFSWNIKILLHRTCINSSQSAH